MGLFGLLEMKTGDFMIYFKSLGHLWFMKGAPLISRLISRTTLIHHMKPPLMLPICCQICEICQNVGRFWPNLIQTSEKQKMKMEKENEHDTTKLCSEVRKAENGDAKRKWVWYNKNILKKILYRNWPYVCLPHLGGDREGSGWAKDWSASCAAGCATSCKAPKFELTMEWTSDWSG